MDKDTRNAIERATQRARRILEDDFVSQLEGTYDVLRSGEVAATGGPHLSPRQRAVREKVVAAIEHKRAAGSKPGEAVAGYVRDAAFTALNRFVALKMLEARALVRECVTKGELSTGYKEFCGLSPGVALLPDGAGYRLYVECLFDELSTEVKVLFDRRDPASALWPNRATFEELLAGLNGPELAGVWIEDETIGWVYQFFNSKEERQALRDPKAGGSSAPRNSRELAVRNQFFTPRYVVRFLADNTLGRTWTEMMGEGTRLVEKCEFLVTRVESRGIRPKKDPRAIRILDPACGSGHFLLYAFDLLLPIYEEAWGDPDAAPLASTGRTLRQDYPDRDGLHRAVPGLILSENLHGVDIDPRCAQIAALALWLRAQRAFREFGVTPSERPRITRTHIVVAEPMPGDAALVEAFAAGLQPPLLADLFRKMVAEMRLAGELGSLIGVDKGIAKELEWARREWRRERETGGLLPGLGEYRVKQPMDLSYIEDAKYFEEAETLLLTALRSFAESAEGGAGVKRRLFAEDALQGISLIDVLRKKFDVVLMNPPFGVAPPAAFENLKTAMPDTYTELYASFLSRGLELLDVGGHVGAITSRAFLTIRRLERFRRTKFVKHAPLLLDLGPQVMDGAFVEACAYIVRRDSTAASLLAFDARSTEARADLPQSLTSAASSTPSYVCKWSDLESLPSAKCLYSLDPALFALLTSRQVFEPSIGTVRQGMGTFDDFRFVRLRWEVPAAEVGMDRTWELLAKGGPFSRFYSDIHLLLNWKHDGAELCEINIQHNGQTAQVRQASDWWRREGCTYSKRSVKGFSARVLPQNCIITGKGPAILSLSRVPNSYLLGWLNSRLIVGLIELQANAAEFNTGILKTLPWVEPTSEQEARVSALALEAFGRTRSMRECEETDPYFECGAVSGDLKAMYEAAVTSVRKAAVDVDRLRSEISRAIDEVYGVGSEALPSGTGLIEDEGELAEEEEGPEEMTFESFIADQVMWWLGCAFGRFDVLAGISSVPLPLLGDPFGAQPIVAPGEFRGARADYPIEVAQHGVLVDDDGHRSSVRKALRAVASARFGADAEAAWEVASERLDPGQHDLLSWVRSQLFSRHLGKYSKSRRKAPIYWQLSGASGVVSIWLYAHRLTRDTLFHVGNEILDPWLALEERRLGALRAEAGSSPSSTEWKEINRREIIVEDLRALRDEVIRIAPLWSPDLNDGVLLTMAPLWRLVPQHRAWQKELKTAWDSLCAGEYDWAHLAMHLWPERVVPKCATDRSLAIAHGLEDVFWVEGSNGKWTARAEPTRPLDELIRERTSPAVKAALQSLVEAPAAQGTAKPKRAKGAR